AIGLELGITLASIGLRGEPTGQPVTWNADVAAAGKRDLAAGETLDGEGGYCVYGTLRAARASREEGCLPLGLAQGMKLRHAVAAHRILRWEDVIFDENAPAITFRREMERAFLR